MYSIKYEAFGVELLFLVTQPHGEVLLMFIDTVYSLYTALRLKYGLASKLQCDTIRVTEYNMFYIISFFCFFLNANYIDVSSERFSFYLLHFSSFSEFHFYFLKMYEQLLGILEQRSLKSSKMHVC